MVPLMTYDPLTGTGHDTTYDLRPTNWNWSVMVTPQEWANSKKAEYLPGSYDTHQSLRPAAITKPCHGTTFHAT